MHRVNNMGNKPLISFIIPAHNASQTVGRTVNSIISQCDDSKKIEIIIVENTSTDNTNEICEKFARENDNVSFYHSEKGVSNARNKGIAVAKGEWLFFIDADDYLLPNSIAHLLTDAQKMDDDLIIYNYQSGNSRIYLNDNNISFNKDNVLAIKEKMLKNPTKFMTVWGKLFRKSTVIENDVKFNPELVLSEDSDFIIQACEFIKNASIRSDFIYHYSINKDSTVHQVDGKKILNYTKALEVSEKTILKQEPELSKAYNSYILMHLNLIMVHEIFAIQNKQGWFKRIELLKSLISLPIFTRALKTVRIQECRTGRMIPILLIKLKLYNLTGLLCRIRIHQNNAKAS